MNSKSNTFKKAPLYRQLFAMIYDSFLIIAVLFLATSVLLIFNQGEAINVQESPLYPVFLLIIIFTFYAWFWKKGGQTLGMRAWKLKIVTDNGYLPNLQQSYTRLFFSILSFLAFGLGYFWALIYGYTWHDKLSQTQIIDIREVKEKK